MANKINFTPSELMELLISYWEGNSINPVLIERARRSFGNSKEMRKIIDQQCEYREQTHCYSCNAEISCLIFNGIAYLDLEEHESGIREIEKANIHFRSEDLNWHLIIGLTLIGYAYEQIRKNHRAVREYQRALDTLEEYKRFYDNEYDRTVDVVLLERKLRGIIDELNQSIS